VFFGGVVRRVGDLHCRSAANIDDPLGCVKTLENFGFCVDVPAERHVAPRERSGVVSIRIETG
jgi:hypothetical protein